MGLTERFKQSCAAWKIKLVFAILFACCLKATAQGEREWAKGMHVWNILDAGAIDNGVTNNTSIIQRLIDSCSQNGGGVVFIPNGRFLTGTLYLKDDVTLYLEEGAVLLGSTNPADYPPNTTPGTGMERRSLLYAENARHITVAGRGCIDGQGHHAAFYKGNDAPGRPRIIHFIGCSDVTVENITLKNAAFWVQYYSGCDGVFIHGIKVYSHANWNNDGLDVDSRNVTITGCRIDSDDDALCFKSESAAPCANITVSNCVLASNCNAIKMGTASRTGFRNISISNCVITAAAEDNIRHWQTTLQHITAAKTVLSGIAIENVDGGHTENITVSNIVMTDVQTPVFIRLGDRSRNNGATGSLRNVLISHVTAAAASLMPSAVTGIPGCPVENVSLENIIITCPGGGTAEQARMRVPEQEKAYPENRMFGYTLPAAGIYARHVNGLSVQNLQVRLAAPDNRPVLLCDDVSGIVLQGLQLKGMSAAQTGVHLLQCRDALVGGCLVTEKIKHFMLVEGKHTANISLQGNNLSLAEKPVKEINTAGAATVNRPNSFQQ
jgi:hypothetical protein